MAKNKWRCREYTPSGNMTGSHSFYAEAVITTDLTNDDLADRIQARTGFKSYEVEAVIAAIAEVVAEEVLESNRITLSDRKGTKMVSIYPKVSGSISDADVQANPTKYAGATKATEEMLTPDMLTWTLGATMGVKFSKQFAHDKQAQKVRFVATDEAIPGDDTPTPTPDPTPGPDEGISGNGSGNGNSSGGSNPPSGGNGDETDSE